MVALNYGLLVSMKFYDTKYEKRDCQVKNRNTKNFASSWLICIFYVSLGMKSICLFVIIFAFKQTFPRYKLKHILPKWWYPSFCLKVISSPRLAMVKNVVTIHMKFITLFSGIDVILLKSRINRVVKIVLNVSIVKKDTIVILVQ